ncbi:MAG TPA: transglycosylase SLT domain-containing protein [Anaeromyxobacteraceae bacterium]|nr:transglycosylase SLT domain-containing protein [Anaeromyxobacteraceae bacterium]
MLLAVLGLVLAAAPAVAVTELDIRPVFEAGPLAETASVLRSGAPAEVAKALEGRPQPEARFLRARALLQVGRGGEALAALSGLAPSLPAVSDRVYALTGEAAVAAGRPEEAARAFGQVPEGSLAWPGARLALARLAAAAGRPAEAGEVLRRLLALPAPLDLSRPDPAARALLLAGRTVAATDPAQARHLLLDCYARHPLAPEARECRSSLDALEVPYGAPPGDEESLQRAEALLDWNRNELALSEARRLADRFPEGSPEACRASFVKGKALRKLRQYGRAAEVLGLVDKGCPDPALRARALYLLAVARANLDSGEGVRTYRRFAREFPDHPQADDALFFAADLLSREGAVPEARRLLAELVERYPQGDFVAEAMFRSAWLARRAGDLDGAISSLERIEDRYRDLDPYEHARAAYWRGRALGQRGRRGDEAAAKAVLASVVKRYPADYYGLLAQARLGSREEERRAPPPAVGFEYRPGPLAADPHFRAALALFRLGLLRDAADELNAVDRKAITTVGPEGPEPLLLLAELLDRAGDPKAAHGLLRSQGRQVLRQPPAGMGLRVWQVAYPPAFRDEVLRWARPARVPPDLLQAIMREESALDPVVVSPAGAVGLTQLMVPTAREAARRLGLRAPGEADLMEASLNIRLGAVHLGDLLRRFGGSAPLAVAAYNAGETPVRTWWKAEAGKPLDEFVEEIPIQETRGYVKRVLRSYAAYRMLYGRPGDEVVRLPERLPRPSGEGARASAR